MGNLKYLKGSEDFGKIRVNDDYTNGKRDLIRQWVKEAEKKSAVDANKVYRVRGDPKNGLRLVSFARQNKPSDLGLKCMYSNVDQLLNKMGDLKLLIAANAPDILLLTESSLKDKLTQLKSHK